MCICCVQSRLPEIDELQRQLTFAHEQLSDMQFAQAAQQTAATQAAQEAAGQQESLRGQIQVGVQLMSTALLCVHSQRIANNGS